MALLILVTNSVQSSERGVVPLVTLSTLSVPFLDVLRVVSVFALVGEVFVVLVVLRLVVFLDESFSSSGRFC